jgi:transposase-like protein
MEVSRGVQRKVLLEERDEAIVAFMERGRPVAAIAELLGLEENYCRKATRRLAEERGLDYKPVKEPPTALLSEASRRLRNNLANLLYDYRNKPGRHQLEVARDTGLTQAQQILATERGGQHNFKLSELERVATATGQDFTRMLIVALLKGTTEADQLRLKRVLACLSN